MPSSRLRSGVIDRSSLFPLISLYGVDRDSWNVKKEREKKCGWVEGEVNEKGRKKVKDTGMWVQGKKKWHSMVWLSAHCTVVLTHFAARAHAEVLDSVSDPGHCEPVIETGGRLRYPFFWRTRLCNWSTNTQRSGIKCQKNGYTSPKT